MSCFINENFFSINIKRSSFQGPFLSLSKVVCRPTIRSKVKLSRPILYILIYKSLRQKKSFSEKRVNLQLNNRFSSARLANPTATADATADLLVRSNSNEICWLGKFWAHAYPQSIFFRSKLSRRIQKLIGFQKLKMNWLLVAICLGSLSLAYGKCSTSFQFRAVCHHYLYGPSCEPGFEDLCKPVKTTYSNPTCPVLICVSLSILNLAPS